jgi:predicted acetyltransferase
MNEPSDLALDASELGAIYLGGTWPSELVRAGLITGSDEAVRGADDMFGWHIEPWCPELF